MPAGPTGGVTSYTYDAAGQQLTETDPDGQVSVFGYDQLGREISENDYSSQAEYDNDPGDPDETLTWTYNAAGQLASESDQIFYGSGSSSTTSYTYDAFGRTESETQATSGAPTVEFDYTYDNNGNVLTETDTAAGALVETTTYSGYNGLNLPAMVVVATTAATLTIDYQYSSVGQTEQMTRYQDGELVDTTTYTYDGDGNLSEEKVVGPSGSTLEDFQYVYNGEGEIVTAITPTQGYVEYTYDAAGQLTSATYPKAPWANESYTYDAAGNRTSTTTGSTTDDTQQTAASTTTAGNELTSDGTFVYEYDADGNLIYQARISQAYSADDQTFYSYNNQNELIDVCTEDNGDTITQEVTYGYNAAGQRMSESVTVGQNTTATDFVYDLSGNAVLSFDGNQNLTGQYIYGQAVDQLLAQEDGSGNVSWMITDRDQSVRDVLQSGGGTTSVIDHIDYNSFGETITETAPSTPHLTGYAGYVNDLAIGMLETDSRVYDASIGRFISQDPSGFAGSANGNLYEYTSNSPLSNVDPSGLMQQSPLAQVLNSMPVTVASTPIDFGDDDSGDDDDDSGVSLQTQWLLQNVGAMAAAGQAIGPVSTGSVASDGTSVDQYMGVDSVGPEGEDDENESDEDEIASRGVTQYAVGATNVPLPTTPGAEALEDAEGEDAEEGDEEDDEDVDNGVKLLKPISPQDAAGLLDMFPMKDGETPEDYLASFGYYLGNSPTQQNTAPFAGIVGQLYPQPPFAGALGLPVTPGPFESTLAQVGLPISAGGPSPTTVTLVTNMSALFDYPMLAYQITGPAIRGITGPQDVADALDNFPDGSVDRLYISGHGYGTYNALDTPISSLSGVQATTVIAASNFTPDQVATVQAALAPSAAIVLLGCNTASSAISSMSALFGVPVVGNMDGVTGNVGEGNWVVAWPDGQQQAYRTPGGQPPVDIPVVAPPGADPVVPLLVK